jgi:hypothetical protein
LHKNSTDMCWVFDFLMRKFTIEPLFPYAASNVFLKRKLLYENNIYTCKMLSTQLPFA